jgi:hypothetical protein
LLIRAAETVGVHALSPTWQWQGDVPAPARPCQGRARIRRSRRGSRQGPTLSQSRLSGSHSPERDQRPAEEKTLFFLGPSPVVPTPRPVVSCSSLVHLYISSRLSRPPQPNRAAHSTQPRRRSHRHRLHPPEPNPGAAAADVLHVSAPAPRGGGSGIAIGPARPRTASFLSPVVAAAAARSPVRFPIRTLESRFGF